MIWHLAMLGNIKSSEASAIAHAGFSGIPAISSGK